MKDNKKKIEEQERLLDHLIEYGGRQLIDEEIQKFEDLPEMEIPKDLDDRMDKMFEDAYRQETRKERIHLGKKIAAGAVIFIGAASVTAMNVKAFREPILNFIFNQNHSLKNKTQVGLTESDDENNNKNQFQFEYIPDGYKCVKEQYSDNNSKIMFDYKKDSSFLYITVQLNQKDENYIKQTETGDYEKIFVDNETFFFLEGEQNTLLFYKNTAIFNITSIEPKSEMIKIAQNISKK